METVKWGNLKEVLRTMRQNGSPFSKPNWQIQFVLPFTLWPFLPSYELSPSHLGVLLLQFKTKFKIWLLIDVFKRYCSLIFVRKWFSFLVGLLAAEGLYCGQTLGVSNRPLSVSHSPSLSSSLLLSCHMAVRKSFVLLIRYNTEQPGSVVMHFFISMFGFVCIPIQAAALWQMPGAEQSFIKLRVGDDARRICIHFTSAELEVTGVFGRVACFQNVVGWHFQASEKAGSSCHIWSMKFPTSLAVLTNLTNRHLLV